METKFDSADFEEFDLYQGTYTQNLNSHLEDYKGVVGC